MRDRKLSAHPSASTQSTRLSRFGLAFLPLLPHHLLSSPTTRPPTPSNTIPRATPRSIFRVSETGPPDRSSRSENAHADMAKTKKTSRGGVLDVRNVEQKALAATGVSVGGSPVPPLATDVGRVVAGSEVAASIPVPCEYTMWEDASILTRRQCHPGPCPPCQVALIVPCPSHHTALTVKCAVASSNNAALTPVCDEVCERLRDCGNRDHACEVSYRMVLYEGR